MGHKKSRAAKRYGKVLAVLKKGEELMKKKIFNAKLWGGTMLLA